MPARAFRPVDSVIVAVLVAMAVGCGGSGNRDPRSPAAPDGTYEIRGTVVSVDAGRRFVEINHEAIPGLMPAMTMPYEVADPSLLQGLASGDRVRGTLRVDSRGYVITSLQRL